MRSRRDVGRELCGCGRQWFPAAVFQLCSGVFLRFRTVMLWQTHCNVGEFFFLFMYAVELQVTYFLAVTVV
jgi:hypothetical protein